MATVTLTKSGTLNPATGVIDNDDATTTAYAAGDTLSITTGAQLKINTSTAARKPGTLQVVTGNSGTLFVENTSTTVPIVVELSADTMDIIMRSDGLFKVRGDWITCYTEGAAEVSGQTIDFSATGVFNPVAIDFPPFLMVETGNATNVWEPYLNIAKSTDTGGVAMTEVGPGIELGRFFSFDYTTKVATFGNNVNGQRIPAYARVRIPNIHFTSAAQATLASRSQINPNTGGAFDFSICSWSDNWDWRSGVFFQASSVTFADVGIAGGFSIAATLGNVSVAGLYCSLDHYVASAQSCLFSTGFGSFACTGWYSAQKHVSSVVPGYFNATGTVADGAISNIHGYILTPVSTSRNSIQMDSIAGQDSAPITISDLYCVGGRLVTNSLKNLRIKNLNHSDQCTGVAVTTNATSAIASWGASKSENIVLQTVRKITGGAACRAAVVSIGSASTGCCVHDVVYDMAGNSTFLAQPAGTRSWMTNFSSASAPVTTTLQSGNIALPSRGRAANIITTAAPVGVDQTIASVGRQFISYTAATPGSVGGQPDVRPFKFGPTNAGRTLGQLNIGPFGIETYEDLYTGFDANNYVNRQGQLLLPSNSVDIVLQQPEPITGIVQSNGFSTATAITVSGTSATTNVTYSFRMRVPSPIGANAWGSWIPWTIGTLATGRTELQDALTALSGYSPNVGFDFQIRVQTTGATAGRYLSYVLIPGCTASATYTPTEIGFIQVGSSGAVTASSMMVSSGGTNIGYSSTGSGTTFTEFPYNFDGVAKAYQVQVRKAGYGEVISTGSCYQAGMTVPISQTQYVSVNEGTAAALTGIAIVGDTSVTVTETHSLDELYAYCQWWAMQRDNMGYDIPLVTTDGVSYTSTYAWTIDAAIAITGTGSVDLGSEALTMGAGASSTFDWAYSTTKTWTRLSVTGLLAGSRVRVYNSTGAVEWSNAVVAGTSLEIQKEYTAAQTVDVRVTKLGYLSWSQTAVYGSTGGAVLAGQEADAIYTANAIDGSLVTEFTADYPNVQIDVSDGDGTTTVQRIYAWFAYTLTSATGIVDFFGAMTAVDAANYEIDQSIANILLQNTSALATVVVGARLYRKDGTTIFVAGTGPIQHDPSKAYLALDGIIEGSTSFVESMRLQNAILAGKVSGAGTGTETFRDLADTKDRIVATVDANGNRTAITRDVT